MGDLEICKRIAEIESINFDCVDGKIIKIRQGKVTMHKGYYDLDGMMKKLYATGNIYNPLTDDALCFQLMVKYKVHMGHYGKEEAEVFIDNCMDVCSDKSPNKAICLAIIESHKES